MQKNEQADGQIDKRDDGGSQTLRMQYRSSVTLNPLPPAKELERLSQYVPDVGNRLLNMVESDSAALREERAKTLELDAKALELANRGIRNDLVETCIIVGAALVIFAFAFRLFVIDKPLPAAAFTTITALLGYYKIRRPPATPGTPPKGELL